jgi:hypothetical protein
VALSRRILLSAGVLTTLGVFAVASSGSSRPAPAAGTPAAYALVTPGTQSTPSPAGTTLLRQAAKASLSHGHGWLVGFDKESVDPTADQLAAGVHLGGYGLGPTRTSTGPLVDGDGAVEHIYARALAISNKQGQTLLLADLENQGTFAAYKQGPYGIWDMRQQVAQDLHLPVEDIVVNSDHSHAGPDLIGLWGGVPVGYLQLVHDRTVKALESAYANRVEADLELGTDTPVVPTAAAGGYLPGTATPGETFDHSQFSPDSANGYPDDRVDTQLRVLQAYDDSGRPLGTLINYAAHATVMGSGNVGYSADWPGRVAQATERALGEPVAVTMPADVGRTQPPRPHSDPLCGQAGHPSCDVDQLDTWTRLFTPWVLEAVAEARPVTGSQVASQEVLTREAGTNPALLGVSYSGEAPVRGFGADRSATPPWITGTLIGTFVSAHRIGNILLTANPGEAYPDIRFALLSAFKTPPQAAFTFGLANDQLGYLIAPASEYGWITASNPGNDNSFFNVSIQYGDHIYCTQLAETQALGFALSPSAQPYGPDAAPPVCAAESGSDAVPMGPAPQQPWPFGDGQSVAVPGQ